MIPKILIVIVVILTIIVITVASIVMFFPSIFETPKTTPPPTSTKPKSTTSTDSSQSPSSTTVFEGQYSTLEPETGTTTFVPKTTTIAPTTTSAPKTTTIAPTTTIGPTTTIAPTTTAAPIILSYTTNITVWLDATSSSNWLGSTWVNNAPTTTKSSNATLIKGDFTASSRVSNAINNLPGIAFTGYNALGTTETKGNYSSGVTMFVVFKPTGADTYRTLVNKTISSYPAPFDTYSNVRFVGSGSSGSNYFFYSGVNLNTLTLNTPYIFAYRISVSGTTASVSEWLNGSVQYSNLLLAGYTDNGTSIQIGTRDSKNTTFTGYIGEIIIYKNALTDAQVDNVHTYLSTKWKIGITISYPDVVAGRYLRIVRNDNRVEYINIAEIQAFNSSGVRYTATEAWLSSTPYSEYPASNLLDNNPNTIGHTSEATNSWAQIGFGSDKQIGKVVVVNRQDCCYDRIVGSCLMIFTTTGYGTWYAEYLSPKITTSLYMYEFLFDVQNLVTITWYSSKGTENANIYIDSMMVAAGVVSKSLTTRTYRVGYKPSTISIVYTNDSTVSGQIYLTKLDYNGKDLISTYTYSSNTTIQTEVRNKILQHQMTFTFSV